MYRGRINVFVGAFVLTFFALYGLFHWIGERQARLYQEEITILHSEVENRFKLLVDNTESILLISSTILADGKDFDKTYEDLTMKILMNFEGILGLNFVDPAGVITKVAPFDRNKVAFMKTSQNYFNLKTSLKRGENLFVSAPFDLYQGFYGIAFYKPLFRGTQHIGWFAIVQGLGRFMEKFVNSSFLGAYHLIVQDLETGRAYYSSSQVLSKKEKLIRSRAFIKGREIEFISWRKHATDTYVSWFTIVLCSFVVAVFTSFFFWALEQRTRAKKELENIEVLLRSIFTSTSTNLNSIQEQLELVKMGSGFVPLKKISTYVSHLSTLINQLRILVKRSEVKELERTSFLTMLIDLSKLFASKMQMKDLRMSFEPQEFIALEVPTAHWSVYHGALECVLDYFVHLSQSGDEIKIFVEMKDAPTVLIVNPDKVHPGAVVRGESFPENLIKATIALESQNGKLVLKNNEDRGAVALISLPGAIFPPVAPD